MVKFTGLLITLGFFANSLMGQYMVTSNPDSAVIITSDIDHFWKAFDLLLAQHTTADSIRIIENSFVSKASEGLQQYMKAANCYAAEYLDAIKKRKPDYLKIRERTEEIAGKKKTLIQYLHRFKQLYHSIKIPAICFTIGKFEVGGTQFDNTLFIGCEVDISQKVDVSVQAIHEIAHFQQKYPNTLTNLETAMIEGGAEFACYQVTGKRTLTSTWAYGLANEKILWKEFRLRMDSATDMKWFLNTADTATGRPGSLGYFIGFKICESYLKSHDEKKSAMIDLIEMTEPIKIYLASRYELNN